jgi:hypothetical protein
MESNMEIPQKAKSRLLCDPVILLLGIYPKQHKTRYNSDTSTLIFIAALFTTAKLWKQPTYPTTNEWLKKI